MSTLFHFLTTTALWTQSISFYKREWIRTYASDEENYHKEMPGQGEDIRHIDGFMINDDTTEGTFKNGQLLFLSATLPHNTETLWRSSIKLTKSLCES